MKTCTLVKLTLLVAFEGGEDQIPSAALENLGDQLSDMVRQDDRALMVMAEYDSVEKDVSDDCDELGALLDQQWPNAPTTPAAGGPNEWAVDRCHLCGKFLGAGWRVMHLGLCETCRDAAKQ